MIEPADYLGAMLDALAEGDAATAGAVRDLALDAAQAPEDGLGEPSDEVTARVRGNLGGYLRKKTAGISEERAAAAELLVAIREAEQRKEGERWQGPSGRWFTIKGGHAVPAAAPGGGDDSPEEGRKMADDREPINVESVLAKIDEWEDFDYYGLRQLHDGKGNPLDASEGDELGPSWVWDDDRQTDEQLEGTSTIGFDRSKPDSVRAAISLASRYSLGTWVIVGSNEWRGNGQDRGEVLLDSPTVLGVFAPPG